MHANRQVRQFMFTVLMVKMEKELEQVYLVRVLQHVPRFVYKAQKVSKEGRQSLEKSFFKLEEMSENLLSF